MNMRLALALAMLVTMVTAINLRKQYRPVDDGLKEHKFKNDPVPEEATPSSCLSCGATACCSPSTCHNNYCYLPIVPVVESNDFENDPVPQETTPSPCPACGATACCSPATCYKGFCYPPLVVVSNDYN